MTRDKKLALVTGAARGIGAATARALAAKGYFVVLTDRIDEEGAARTKAICDQGGEAEYISLDVTDTLSVNTLISEYEQRFGAFSVVVNNAGFVKQLPYTEFTDEDWDEVFDTNIKGMLRVCRAAAPAMEERRDGSIICMTSIAGYTIGWPQQLAYCSSKAGIAGFVKSLAMELGPSNIRVNGIAPAGLHASADDVPLKRVGTPEDIADAVLLLASEKARFITGQILNVDGGFSVKL